MINPFSAGAYDFRPVTHDDLQMVSVWLHTQHVQDWWGNPRQERDLIANGIDQEGIDGLIVAHNFVPFAFVQMWDPHFLGIFPDQPIGTWAIDTFIGLPDMLGKGHGAAIVSAVSERLLEEGAPRVIIDPDPMNRRAIRAYEKAGFTSLGTRKEANGTVQLMARDRAKGHGK